MTSFAPREAMKTAEPPVAVTVSAFRFLFPQQFSSGTVGLGGEAILFIPCIQWTTCKIRVHSCAFVVLVKWFGCGQRPLQM